MRTTGVLGAVLVALACLVGAAVLWLQPTEYGWFAYAGTATGPSPDLVLLTPRRWVALAVAGVALVLLGAAGGAVLGRRRA